jgi:hypothetical protein
MVGQIEDFSDGAEERIDSRRAMWRESPTNNQIAIHQSASRKALSTPYTEATRYTLPKFFPIFSAYSSLSSYNLVSSWQPGGERKIPAATNFHLIQTRLSNRLES